MRTLRVQQSPVPKCGMAGGCRSALDRQTSASRSAGKRGAAGQEVVILKAH